MLLTIMPGPDIMYVLVQSISNGKKHGIATAAGLVSGILVHTSFVAFGVSAIISSSPSLFFLLKLCGALYLVYLAYKTFKSGQEIHLVEVEEKKLEELFKKGFIPIFFMGNHVHIIFVNLYFSLCFKFMSVFNIIVFHFFLQKPREAFYFKGGGVK